MNKIVSFLLFIVVISATSYSQKQKEKFEIIGKLDGFSDSTLIFLDDKDSTFIINNQFHFIGSLKENVKKALIK